ncbi:MAG TPA: DUF6807 family protein, partial [Gemmataceae bacterium]|nr:DUF6807 family protein [Gemmataceae bacterium]
DSPKVALKDAAGKDIAIGQLTPPGVLTKIQPVAAGEAFRELHFILPSLMKGQTLALKAHLSTDGQASGTSFVWKDTPGEYAELSFGNRPVLRYMYHALDESSKEKRDQTFKVFHHLYDPTGTRLVTNGPSGLFPHHRGLFFGFNKTTYGDGKLVDTWHCTGDTYQSHERFLESVAGPVLGRHRVEIAWHGKGKEVFAKEQRELTVYNVPGGQLVQFETNLTTTGGPIKLDGDPQHAGFHFRAANEVAEKTKQQTIFIRPDGPGQPGTETNWEPRTRKGPVNLPWNAMSFVLGNKRYTAAYLDHTANPKEARESERTYGRIGSYFEYVVTAAWPLHVRYRIWLQEGQMSVPEIAAKSAAFVSPADVLLK